MSGSVRAGVQLSRVRAVSAPNKGCVSLRAVEVGTSVQPSRVRNRPKAEPDEKVKKPGEGVRKKTPPVRKAPARGRYVDEYARPSA